MAASITDFARRLTRSRTAEIRATIAAEFDADHYCTAYPGLASAMSGQADPIQHYIDQGWREGRDPCAGFSTDFYLAHNPDVREAGINPFYHYLKHGQAEGRAPGPAGGAVALQDRALMAGAFDAAFYRAAHPGMSGTEDPLSHYIAEGWRLGLDPAPSFSTGYYLAANPDIREAAQNPFLHYLKHGRAEGRASQPSSRKPLSKPAVPAPRPLLRTGVLLMVRNEIDIIASSLAHLLALFDVLVVVDHGSCDGTEEVLAAVERSEPGLHLYHLEEPGYLQALTMTHLVQTAPELRDLDWIFLMDADEFLPLPDRAALHEALATHSQDSVISMSWQNAVPAQFWQGEVSLDDPQHWFLPRQSSSYRKIAFQPRCVKRADLWIEQGNHRLLNRRDGLEIEAAPASFAMIHLPVRSRAQLTLKLHQGTRSYLARRDRGRTEGAHWFALHQALAGRDITPEMLNAVIADYGALTPDLAPLDHEHLLRRGFIAETLEFAQARLDLPDMPSRETGDLLLAFSATPEDGEPDPAPVTRLETLADGRIRRAEGDHGASFAALTIDESRYGPLLTGSESGFDLVSAFLRPSYWPIETLVPSAWAGHIPFLFALTALEQPRRYVELGTHFGASFLAYCQAAERLGFETDPIAIDTWEGDAHAGFYDESVFERFTFLLRKYQTFARFLRMRFAEAAPRFATGSIDLLLIDGLHTDEAVIEDFETWLPKMSDRGIILFHDTHVHERDFGVWRLWRRVAARYPSTAFCHSNGLGVAYVGSRPDRPIVELLALMREDPAVAELMQQHFENISQKSCDLFISQFELSRKEDQDRVIGRMTDEISRLKQSLGTAESERDQIRGLLTGPALAAE